MDGHIDAVHGNISREIFQLTKNIILMLFNCGLVSYYSKDSNLIRALRLKKTLN